MSRHAPHLLFAPYYKHGGTGEFARAVTLAQAAQRHWPDARIEFLLPGGAETRDDCPFPHAFNDRHLDKPSRVTFLSQEIVRRRPHLVIFDSYSAPPILDQCRRVGARSAYVAETEGNCRRAFEWRWLRRLDAHWQQRPFFGQPAFTPGQRLRAQLGTTRRVVFDVYFDESAELAPLPPSIEALAAGPYALFAPGGGGFRVGERYVGDIFYEAAERLHQATGLPAITVLGGLHPGPMPAGTTTVVHSLSMPALIRLMRGATLVVTNGATSLTQALSCGAACIAAPLGGSDQPARIAAHVSAGRARAADPDAAALAAAAVQLSGETETLRRSLQALRPVNGIPLMIRLIEEQLQLRSQQMAR